MNSLAGNMKAVVIRGYGGPELLEYTDLPRPTPGEGEVLIRVEARGVNPADAKWRSGMFAEMVPLKFPYVPGYDVAGTVAGGGSIPMGSRVFAMLDNRNAGAYAEFAVVAETAAALIPIDVDYATAAALPTSALTGVQLIESHIAPAAGARVLITGSVGAVGRFALYAAKQWGAYVIAAVRAGQRAEALTLGADEAIVLGDASHGPLRLDHLVDTVGGADVAALCAHVRSGGRIRTVSTTPIPSAGLASAPQFVAVRSDRAQLEAIARVVAAGDVVVPIARRYPLSAASAAHRALDAGGVGGKIILF